TDLADVTMLAGGANLTMDVTSHGNRLSALRSQAKGQIDFNLAKGEFRKLNLTHYACQGIALVNQDSLTKTDWADVTPFNDMKGTLVIDGNTLNNKDLVAALAGMKLEGNGQVHLDTSKVDYKLGLKIVGEIDKDKACRVTEVVQDVVIPVECKGDYSKEPGKLCSFDGSRFRDTLKTIAANAAKKKATSEVQKAVDDKLGKQLDKKLDSETSGKVKDAIKGLFK
ncbi:MAG: AsmA-like C-terminal region-containing protein, partial [Marinobacter sp.]|nr:AsmA-like C-terminal region-containing protein [Marinobacter sp.]